MNVSYEFLYSGTPSGSESSVTGLLVKDTDSTSVYILQIPLTDLIVSEDKAGPFDMVEVDPASLEMVNASTLFQSKNVTPGMTPQNIEPDNGYIALTQVSVAAVPLEAVTVSASAQEAVTVEPTSGYLGLSAVTVNQIPLETKSVKSNTAADQTVNPSSGKVGFSQITVQKFDGESGSPDSAYSNGDTIYLKIIPKFNALIDKLPEFKGYYKAIVSDNNASYANAQIMYADDTIGPRIPLFNLIGKVEILTAEEYEAL